LTVLKWNVYFMYTFKLTLARKYELLSSVLLHPTVTPKINSWVLFVGVLSTFAISGWGFVLGSFTNPLKGLYSILATNLPHTQSTMSWLPAPK